MIKILNSCSLSKISRLNNISKFTFCSTSNPHQGIKYPYVFGGLKDVEFVQNQIPHLMVSTYFGEESFQGFKYAYKSVLESLAEKDLESLKHTLEPNITKNIKLGNVQLINPDADIQVICGKYFITIGAGFIRQESTQFQLLYKSQSKQIDRVKDLGDELKKNFYVAHNSNSPQKGLLGLSSNPYTLQAYEILFRSAMKLVPQGGNLNDKTPQIHSVQFQIEGQFNLSPFNILRIFLLTKIGSLVDPVESRRKVLKQIIGQNFQWRIGDIDRLLKGNRNETQ